MFRAPAWAAQFPDLAVAESTRHGGVSPAPYQSLNLGWSTEDAPENTAENRRRFAEALGFGELQMASSHQVHGNEVLKVMSPGRYDGYDALITQEPGILLAVSVADCVPVLIYDPANKAIAAIHAGWRGAATGIVAKTIAQMHSEFQTNPADCFAFIGTCIDECSFEVNVDVADHFAEDFKRWDPALNKFFVDLKNANKSQLLTAGLSENRIEISPFSTVIHNEDYFSHRKEKGITGRFTGAIGKFSHSHTPTRS